MSFSYYTPNEIGDLFDLLAEKKDTARIIAGGTDVLVELRDKNHIPECLIDINRIPGLKGVYQEGEMIFIGPLTTFTELIESPVISERAFLLAQAALTVGSPQIRNQGTIGGNIVNASPAADTVPALLALDAKLRLSSRGGQKEMPLEDFMIGIGKTRLAPGEVVTGISFKALPEQTGSSFLKLGRRNALAISRISIAVIVGYEPENLVCTDCRIAVGSVASNPFRLKSAEYSLLNCGLNRGKRDACVAAALQEITVTLGQRASASYKKKAAPPLVRRAIDEAIGRVFGGWEEVL